MPGKEDYFLRHLSVLRQFLAQVAKLRVSGQPEQAMVVLMQAQEKLFCRPPSQVLALGLEDQLRLLATGVSQEDARECQIGYALLLKEAGLCYADRGRPEIAATAFGTALRIVRTLEAGGAAPEPELLDLARDLSVLVSKK